MDKNMKECTKTLGQFLTRQVDGKQAAKGQAWEQIVYKNLQDRERTR